MRTLVKIRRAWEKIIVALSEFDYLTTHQLTRLLYSPSSIKHVQEEMKSLMDASLVTAVGGKAVNLPRIYTLSGMGSNTHQSWAHPKASGSGLRKNRRKDTIPISSSIRWRSLMS